MKKLGFIVNPVAGMGGRVGLKGSDGEGILKKARELGAKPEAPGRAVEALKIISRVKNDVEIITPPHEMGEDECRQAGFDPKVIGSITSGATTPEDTMQAAKAMVVENVDIILFAGGDGTARNIYKAVGERVPTLGIPAGVKIHSGVYAVNPKGAGEVCSLYLEGKLLNIREAEVMDIDEDAFRQGIVTAKLYGYLKVPEERRFVQSVKSGGVLAEKESLVSIVSDVVDQMTKNPETFFIVGPGTTTRNIMDDLKLKNTLLGVDIVQNKRLIANDVAEAQIWEIVQDKPTKIVVTIIGGQGHVFGRGNQQLSPRILRNVEKSNIIIIATKEKLTSLQGRPLLVDTGDEGLNEELSGYMRVTTGYGDYMMYKVGY